MAASPATVPTRWNDETNDGRTQRRHPTRPMVLVLVLVLVLVIGVREFFLRRSIFCAGIFKGTWAWVGNSMQSSSASTGDLLCFGIGQHHISHSHLACCGGKSHAYVNCSRNGISPKKRKKLSAHSKNCMKLKSRRRLPEDPSTPSWNGREPTTPQYQRFELTAITS